MKRYYYKKKNIYSASLVLAGLCLDAKILSYWEDSQKLSDWAFNATLVMLAAVVTISCIISLKLIIKS